MYSLCIHTKTTYVTPHAKFIEKFFQLAKQEGHGYHINYENTFRKF